MPLPAESTYQLARGLGLAAAFSAGLALERWRPHARLRPAWGTNVGLWIIGIAATAAVGASGGWSAAAWAAQRGIGLLPRLGLHPFAAAAVGLVALDAVSYVWHRLNHRVSLLWRFHQVHHGDASFHVTTALRFHPGELLLALPLRLGAIVALGVPPVGALVFEIAFGTANLLEHGNFDLPRRLELALRRVLVTPGLHRTHHAREWRELDTNFGTIFSLWDRLLGTLCARDPETQVVTGLPDWQGAAPPALLDSLWLPFASRRRRPR